MLFKYSFENVDSEEQEMSVFATGTYLIKKRKKKKTIVKNDLFGENISYSISLLYRRSQ